MAVARADGGARSFSAGITAQGTETDQTRMGDSNGPVGAAGGYSVTYNASASSFAICVCALAPSTTAPAAPAFQQQVIIT